MSMLLSGLTWTQRAVVWAKVAESAEAQGRTRDLKAARTNEATCLRMAEQEGER